jgi:hypothetical protein
MYTGKALFAQFMDILPWSTSRGWSCVTTWMGCP